MSESVAFIIDRSNKTVAAARQIEAEWVWQKKTIAEQEAQLAAIIGDTDASPPEIGQEKRTSQAHQFMLVARSTWDTKLDLLHRRTVQGVAMARTRYQDDPIKARLLVGLSANSHSRRATLEEALAWESAWDQLDKNWAPLPANTFQAFRTLREDCVEELQTAYLDARAAWREEAEKLGTMAAALEATNVAWYADATAVFLEGTPEGDMIRGTIPTTYNPPPPPPPGGGTPPTPPTP